MMSFGVAYQKPVRSGVDGAAEATLDMRIDDTTASGSSSTPTPPTGGSATLSSALASELCVRCSVAARKLRVFGDEQDSVDASTCAARSNIERNETPSMHSASSIESVDGHQQALLMRRRRSAETAAARNGSNNEHAFLAPNNLPMGVFERYVRETRVAEEVRRAEARANSMHTGTRSRSASFSAEHVAVVNPMSPGRTLSSSPTRLLLSPRSKSTTPLRNGQVQRPAPNNSTRRFLRHRRSLQSDDVAYDRNDDADDSAPSGARSRDDDDDEEDDDGSAMTSEQRRNETLSSAMAQKQTNEAIERILFSNNAQFSYSAVYDAVWCGLSGITREKWWLMHSLTIDSDRTVAQVPPFVDCIDNAFVVRGVYDQILRDLFRTVPSLSGDYSFVNALYRALIAHAVARPDIGYCQGMNALWAVLVRTVSKPQQQLYVAEHICNTLLPHYFTTDGLGPQIDAVVLGYYLQRRLVPVHEQLVSKFGSKNVAMMLINFCFHYFSTMFAFLLPYADTIRLWDMLLWRGAPALFECALRFLKHFVGVDGAGVRTCDTWLELTTRIDAAFVNAKQRGSAATRRLLDDVLREKLAPIPLFDADLRLRRKLAAARVFAAHCGKKR